MSRISPKKSEKLIKTETKRLEEARVHRQIRNNPLLDYLTRAMEVPEPAVRVAAAEAKSLEDFVTSLRAFLKQDRQENLRRVLLESSRDAALKDLNDLRAILGKGPFPGGSPQSNESASADSSHPPTRKRRAGKSTRRARKPLQLPSGPDTST